MGWRLGVPESPGVTLPRSRILRPPSPSGEMVTLYATPLATGTCVDIRKLLGQPIRDGPRTLASLFYLCFPSQTDGQVRRMRLSWPPVETRFPWERLFP